MNIQLFNLAIAETDVTTGQLFIRQYATPTSLDLPNTLTLKEWCLVGAALLQMDHRSRDDVKWWLGDWVNFGERYARQPASSRRQ